MVDLDLEQQAYLVDVLSREHANLTYRRAMLRMHTGSISQSLASDCEIQMKLIDAIISKF